MRATCAVYVLSVHRIYHPRYVQAVCCALFTGWLRELHYLGDRCSPSLKPACGQGGQVHVGMWTGGTGGTGACGHVDRCSPSLKPACGPGGGEGGEDSHFGPSSFNVRLYDAV
jgi:hypothetical protein